MEKVYIIICPENGWDCVEAVYKANNMSVAKRYFMEEIDIDDETWDEQYHILEQRVQNINHD